MPPKSREETLELLAKFAERKLVMEQEEERRGNGMEQAGNYIKWLWTFGSVVAFCASTSAVALYNISQQKDELVKIGDKLDRFRDMDVAHEKRIEANENRIEKNLDERQSLITAMNVQIQELLSRKKEHDIMWSMKEMGRSNKEEYMRVNKTAAPDSPEK